MELRYWNTRNDLGQQLWYKGKFFHNLDECNEFLEENKEFSLLKETKNWRLEPLYFVTKASDLGKEKLDLYFESEDTGFCKKFFKSKDTNQLYALIEEGLYTCQDDAWREPCTKVNQALFNLRD